MSEPIVTPPGDPGTPPEKTFTQAEVDALVTKRLARAMKGVPTEEELSEFRSWKDNQQAHQETITTLTSERDTARGRVTALETEISQLKQNSYVQSKGFSGDDAEFVLYKAAKMVNDKMTFEQAVDQIADERKSKPAFDWSGHVGGGNNDKNANNVMNALIRGALSK